jgi:SAM-dependent methyltransferase
MKPKVELYSGAYKNFAEDLYRDIRKETYGEDIGQNSWITADEYKLFFSVLKLSPNKKILEIATGSGGPAVYMVKETGCHLTGIDINENGVNNALKLAEENNLTEKMNFVLGDASAPLPFPDESFDSVISLDSINHLRDRKKVLKEFKRVLKKGGQLLYTDPIVVTGIITNEEIALRSSIGFFQFVPSGINELLLKETGFRDIESRDVTGNIASVSLKWFRARKKRKKMLLQIEGETNYTGLQSFLNTVHILSSERRLSRILFTTKK